MSVGSNQPGRENLFWLNVYSAGAVKIDAGVMKKKKNESLDEICTCATDTLNATPKSMCPVFQGKRPD